VERFARLSGPPLDAEPEETAPAGEIRCRSGGPARIKRVMGSSCATRRHENGDEQHLSVPAVMPVLGRCSGLEKLGGSLGAESRALGESAPTT
jgi:hypothetical protein